MTYEEYKEGLKINKKALDSIDFIPLLEKHEGNNFDELRGQPPTNEFVGLS